MALRGQARTLRQEGAGRKPAPQNGEAGVVCRSRKLEVAEALLDSEREKRVVRELAAVRARCDGNGVLDIGWSARAAGPFPSTAGRDRYQSQSRCAERHAPSPPPPRKAEHRGKTDTDDAQRQPKVWVHRKVCGRLDARLRRRCGDGDLRGSAARHRSRAETARA